MDILLEPLLWTAQTLGELIVLAMALSVFEAALALAGQARSKLNAPSHGPRRERLPVLGVALPAPGRAAILCVAAGFAAGVASLWLASPFILGRSWWRWFDAALAAVVLGVGAQALDRFFAQRGWPRAQAVTPSLTPFARGALFVLAAACARITVGR